MSWWPDRYATGSDAEFYARALGLILQIQRPFLMAYHTSIAVLVALAFALVIWGLVQVSDRALPVKVKNVELLTPVVSPLGRVRVHYDIDRLRVCAVDISASVFDGGDELHPLVTLHRDVSGPIGDDHFTRSFEVPADAKPGPGRLRVAWAYACPGNYAQVLSPIPLAFGDIPFTIR